MSNKDFFRACLVYGLLFALLQYLFSRLWGAPLTPLKTAVIATVATCIFGAMIWQVRSPK